MPKRLTVEEIQNRLDIKYGNNYITLIDFTKTTDPALFECSVGHIFQAQLKNVLYNDTENPCSACYETKRRYLSSDEMIQEMLLFRLKQDNNKRVIDLLWKHYIDSNNEEVISIIIKTLQHMKGGKHHDTRGKTAEEDSQITDTG